MLPEGAAVPATVCPNCGGTALGFAMTAHKISSQAYQGCNDCSETTWVGGWEDMIRVLEIQNDFQFPWLD